MTKSLLSLIGTRNRAIAKIFKEVGIIKRYGSGIKRVKEACKNYGIEDPIFEEHQHGFKVTLTKMKTSEGINMLLEYISKNPAQRVSQIQKSLNTPAKTLERWIKMLKDDAKIEYRGSKKMEGYYVR